MTAMRGFMRSMPLLLAAAAPLAAQTGRRVPNAPPHDTRPSQVATTVAQPAKDGWVTLFDGTPASIAANWRGFKRNDPPGNWHAENGVLTLSTGGDAAAHGDLVTKEKYGDFEFECDWKISPGGNSGIITRVGDTGDETWQTGPEMQVLDDSGHADGKIPSHHAGALYDLVVPAAGITKPVGQFNHARVVWRGTRVRTYLNGHQTADVDVASPRGQALIAASKFKVYPGFAQQREGYIALQDHGNVVTFRNVRVRRLSPA